MVATSYRVTERVGVEAGMLRLKGTRGGLRVLVATQTTCVISKVIDDVHAESRTVTALDHRLASSSPSVDKDKVLFALLQDGPAGSGRDTLLDTCTIACRVFGVGSVSQISGPRLREVRRCLVSLAKEGVIVHEVRVGGSRADWWMSSSKSIEARIAEAVAAHCDELNRRLRDALGLSPELDGLVASEAMLDALLEDVRSNEVELDNARHQICELEVDRDVLRASLEIAGKDASLCRVALGTIETIVTGQPLGPEFPRLHGHPDRVVILVGAALHYEATKAREKVAA